MFLVCPKCLSAFPRELHSANFKCDRCNHEWNAPLNELGYAYFADISEVDFYLKATTGERYQLKQFPAVIGRDSDFSVLQTNLAISREHCVIDYSQKDKNITIATLENRGATFLNGQRLLPDQTNVFTPGDTLILSGIPIVFESQLRTEEASLVKSNILAKNISVAECEPLGYILDRNEEIVFSSTYSRNAIAALNKIGEGQSWSILALRRDKIIINGNIFVEEFLFGGENLVICGRCFTFDRQKKTFESALPDDGAGIEILNLSAAYGSKKILDDISCSIPEGRLTAILGQSGCGKSTLIKILAGLKSPTSGKITVVGRNDGQNYAYWAEHHLALVPQHDVVHSELTVRQCIEYAADIRLGTKANSQLKAALVEKAIRENKLESSGNKLISDLSGGQRKRVNIAVELIGRPEILLLDEPTTGLDYATERQIIATLRQLTRQGKTVVFVTHSLATIEIADNVIVLSSNMNGAGVIAQGSPDAVKRSIGVVSWQDLFVAINKNLMPDTDVAKFNLKLMSYKAPGMSALFFRYLSIWLNQPISSFILLFGLPLILGILIRLAVAVDAPIGTDRLLFGIVAMFWLGMNQSVREIVKERDIFLQEQAHHVSCLAYLFSKLTFFVLITFPQAVLLTTPILWLMVDGTSLGIKFGQLNCSFIVTLPVIWVAGIIGCTLGLLFSALALFMKQKGEVTAVLLAVVATLPQLLFSAKVIPGGLTKQPDHFYKFICWNTDAPIAEFFSYLTFSRYLFIPLDSISRQTDVIAKSFIINGIILGIAIICMVVISWLILEIYVFLNKYK